MKNRFRSILALLMLVAVVAGMGFVSIDAAAANDFYGDYTDVSKIYDYGSCPSMQGLAVGSGMLYSVKIGSNDSLAFISMTDKDTGTTTKLYNADAGSYYFTELGHANDMDVWGIDGYSHIFVTSTNEGSNAIIRYKRTGNNLNKVASYSLTYNGNPICATALAIKGVSGGKITFITKLGMDLYTGSVSTSAKTANIELTKLCTISKSRVYIKGSYLDLSNFVNQGFGYYNDTLFVPITGDDSQLNRSVIMVYDLRNASGTIYPTEALVFRVTSGYYSALFEIESCDISSGDGKLYFNTNRRKTNSDTNHDGVSYFDGYTFSSLPTNAPTSAPTYTLRYHANGGSGTMADTTVTYGRATPISTCTFTRSGYTFAGYTAYRESKGQWRYQSGWYAEGKQPSGESKYLYSNGEKVAQTTSVNGNVVHLYAQWTKNPTVNNYTVKFVDDDGTVLKSATVAEGTTPTAPANPTKASDGVYSYTFAGWNPAVGAVTGNTTYTATYTATPLVTSGVTGRIDAYLERVTAASDLEEGVPYVISDYKDTWLHYTLTGKATQKTAGSKTHQGFLLDGEPSANTTDLWYIKGGYLVYGGSNSSQYLLISYDSSNQGQVVLGSLDSAKAAYVTAGRGDDLVVRSTTHYLNRHGGTASDFVATAYSSIGGSYWHFDRLHKAQSVNLNVKASETSIPEGGKTVLMPTVTVDGTATQSCKLTFSSSDTSVATVSSNGTVTGVKAGKVTITATLTSANGLELAQPISMKIDVTVKTNTVSASGTVAPTLVVVDSLKTGVPYVISNPSTGAYLTGNMLYTTSTGYQGLSGVQGLGTTNSIDLSNAPVWYYDGSRLLFGSATGSNNYLIYTSSNQVTLGSTSSGKVFDTVNVYSAYKQTFTISSSANSGKYLNQYGGSKYNVVSLWTGASTSVWQFSQLLPQSNVTMTASPASITLAAGKTAALNITVSTGSNNTLNFTSSDESVAVVNSNGEITAVNGGSAVITATLTAVDGRNMSKTASVQIAVQVTNSGSGYTTTAVQPSSLTPVTSLETGVPYVITNPTSGAALTGNMLYTTSTGYKGLSSIQGLELTTGYSTTNPPVWYYDGTGLRYGSVSGKYLILDSSNQVTLGTASSGSVYNTVKLYNASAKTFTVAASAKSGNYLNQYGGPGYNVVYQWYDAGSSQWQFSRYVPEMTVSLNVTPELTTLSKGQTSAAGYTVTVGGSEAADFDLEWSSSGTSVVTVNNGVLTAVGTGSATVTATLKGVNGNAFANPMTVRFTVTVQ